MIKECKVIINNDAVTVVKFGDTAIQFSPIMKDVKTVNVKYENGNYSIVDHAEEKHPMTLDTKFEENIEIKETKKTIKKKHVKVDEQ